MQTATDYLLLLYTKPGPMQATTEVHRAQLRQCDKDNGKLYKNVCITINQPDTKSNPILILLQYSTQLWAFNYLSIEIHARKCCLTNTVKTYK